MYKYKNESIYIAGPECFYEDGFTSLAAMRREAEYYGFQVSLPNDRPLNTKQEELQKNADAIFENCKLAMLDRIPHYGAEKNHKDMYGYEVENFNYPINLMFSSSMPIYQGSFELVIAEIAKNS